MIEDYSNGNDMIIGKPGVKAFKDLKGKKVGLEFGLVEHLLLLKGLEAAGMKDTDVEIVKVATNDTPQTLASGGGGRDRGVVPGFRAGPESGRRQQADLHEQGRARADLRRAAREQGEPEQPVAPTGRRWSACGSGWSTTSTTPATKSDAAKIMAAKVGVNPKQYEKSMAGTAFLDLKGNLERLKKSDSLDSVYGSLKTANDFYLKASVYKARRTRTQHRPEPGRRGVGQEGRDGEEVVRPTCRLTSGRGGAGAPRNLCRAQRLSASEPIDS